ncbi:MAG: universal stress protein [Nitriliruptoraceae bacterium]
MKRIVVGVDGSEGSRLALDWAAQEAGLRAASLEVVTTYLSEPEWAGFPVDGGMSSAQIEDARQSIEMATRRAAEHAQAVVEAMIAGLPDSSNAEPVVVASQRPAEALVERSRGAEMLVVGSRGLGGFKSLMLGSVSHQCVTHADCPVVVIRPAPADGQA